MTQTDPHKERRGPLRHRMASGFVPVATYNALHLAAERRGMMVEGLVAKLLQIVAREDAIRLILNEPKH